MIFSPVGTLRVGARRQSARGLRQMRRLSILLAAILIVGCARRGSLDTPTPVACPAATVPGVDWHDERILGFTVRLPPGFVRESGIYCEHGGEQYVRGRDRVGYCMAQFPPSGITRRAPGEEVFSLFGRESVLHCVRRGRGWSAYIIPIGPIDYMQLTVEASSRATLADLLGALQSAPASKP